MLNNIIKLIIMEQSLLFSLLEENRSDEFIRELTENPNDLSTQRSAENITCAFLNSAP